jgi:hypothetical protein
LNFSLPPRNPIRGCSSKYERRDVPQGQEGEYSTLRAGSRAGSYPASGANKAPRRGQRLPLMADGVDKVADELEWAKLEAQLQRN